MFQEQELQGIGKSMEQKIQEVGYFIRQELGRVSAGQVERKSLNSLVSYVDKQAEEQLVAAAQSLLPHAAFYTEEETVVRNAGSSPWRWIIDPLDGTTNFLHQLPFFSISVALQYQEQTVLGIVYEVNRQELFSAYKGKQSQCNGKDISVSPTTELSESLLATGFPYHDFSRVEHYLRLLRDLFRSCRGLRRFGSAALDLAYVACGRFEGFFEYSLSPWDVAAGAFLVQQAGGFVGDFRFEDNALFGGEILAVNNMQIGRDLQSRLADAFLLD